MNPTRDRRAVELLDQVLELPDDQVAAFLDRTCGDDAEVRKKVESLMTAMGRSGNFLSMTSVQSLDTQRLGTGDVLANRYEIVDIIGVGGMGEVYRATDTRLNRDVAVKTLNLASLRNQEMQDRFDRELKSVAALSDPNIVTLFDVAVHDELIFAVMELINGRTVRQLIADGLDQRTAVKIAKGIASGLIAAHELDIMHRDIKPENFVVNNNCQAKILDFGLARHEEVSRDQQLTVTSMIPGTIPYMSPEQVEGKELSCATDVFSLGTVLHEMVTGANPFRADTALQTMRQVSAAAAPEMSRFVAGIPADLQALVAAMLSAAPESRPTARKVVDCLESLRHISHDALSSSSKTKPVSITAQATGNLVRDRNWQPSLIVLPFQVFESVDALESIADGLVENLTTVLTRVPLLSLTSRMSSFSLKGQSPTADDMRQRFQVDYMVEGSLQSFDGTLRANVQLIETQTGFHLWAQPFECPFDANAVHHLLRSILPRLEPQIIRAISNDLRDADGQANSRELLIRAIGLLSLKGWHRNSFSEVRQLLRESIEREPDFALTHAHLALIQGLGKRVGLVDDEEQAVAEAVVHAERAMDLDGMDSNVLGLAACALSDIGQSNRAIPILLNAIDLNPNNAQAHAALGTAHLVSHDWDQAIGHLQRGIELSPSDGRLAVWYSALALAYLKTDKSDLALTAAQLGCQSDRKTYLPRVFLVAVHLFRNERDEAIIALEESLRVKPDLTHLEVTRLVGRKLGIAIRKLRKVIDANTSS